MEKKVVKRCKKGCKKVCKIKMELVEMSESEVIKAAFGITCDSRVIPIDEVGERVKIKAYRQGEEKHCALCKKGLDCDAKQFKDVCRSCRTKWYSGERKGREEVRSEGKVRQVSRACKQQVRKHERK